MNRGSETRYLMLENSNTFYLLKPKKITKKKIENI